MPIGDTFSEVIRRFDAANAADPHTTDVAGQPVANELLYACRMTDWLTRLSPDASEPLQLAVRCQHIRRWEIPRSMYPMTRPGYHQWRTTLYQFHAEKAGEILQAVGYDEKTISRVQSLVRKERLKTDAEAQMLEDVICLVFLENYFVEFSKRHDEAKIIGILRKTWRKMSAQGQEAAMNLKMPAEARELVEKALG